MESRELDNLVKQRRKKVKYRNQLPIAILLIMICIAVSVVFKYTYNLTVFWVVGIGIGLVLRFARFCFAAVFRDPILIGSTKLLRGMLLAMMVSTIGFSVIQWKYMKTNTIKYELIPGSVSSVGLHVIIGAFLFGIGMIIAGGCASGVLMRIGEGHVLQTVVLVGFIIGTLLGAKHYEFWYEAIIKNAKTIYFTEYFDFKIVTVVQLLVLALIYWFAIKYEKKKIK